MHDLALARALPFFDERLTARRKDLSGHESGEASNSPKIESLKWKTEWSINVSYILTPCSQEKK